MMKKKSVTKIIGMVVGVLVGVFVIVGTMLHCSISRNREWATMSRNDRWR